MTIFTITKASWHLVSPVVESVDPSRKRLAFSGWWVSDDVEKSTALERAKDDGRWAKSFIKHVDGVSGAVLPSKRYIEPD